MHIAAARAVDRQKGSVLHGAALRLRCKCVYCNGPCIDQITLRLAGPMRLRGARAYAQLHRTLSNTGRARPAGARGQRKAFQPAST